MIDKRQDVTDAELAVLEALWSGAATIRKITDRLYPRGGASHYATVQKLLERLENKGFVTRDASAAVHEFAARVGREELIGRRVRAVADRLCGGSIAPLLSSLVSTQRLTPRQIGELRAWIEQLDRKPKRKR